MAEREYSNAQRPPKPATPRKHDVNIDARFGPIEVVTLSIQPGQFLLVRDPAESMDFESRCALVDAIVAAGGAGVIFDTGLEEIRTIDDREMRRYGWVRA